MGIDTLSGKRSCCAIMALGLVKACRYGIATWITAFVSVVSVKT